MDYQPDDEEVHSLGHPTTLLAHIEVKVRTASRCSGLRNMTRGSSFTRRWPHGQRDQMGFPQWLFAESIEEVSVKVLPLKEQMEWRNTSAQIICKDCEACLRTLHQKPTGMARDTRHPCVFSLGSLDTMGPFVQGKDREVLGRGVAQWRRVRCPRINLELLLHKERRRSICHINMQGRGAEDDFTQLGPRITRRCCTVLPGAG